MQLDFHYYATFSAAFLAGFDHEEAVKTAYSAQFVDCCTRTLLDKIGGPLSAATTQSQTELLDARTDLLGLQDITRIWSSFHFLPGDLYAERDRCSKKYLRKYRLICNPNGVLLKDTVELVRGKGAEAAGIAMHILADTWAHRYFAGTPSLVINNTNYHFFEITDEGERMIKFNHNPGSADDPEKGVYTCSLYQGNENSIMNLGHGRAGHFPDYSYARYRYMPAWGQYKEILKDNPSDYMHAFRQMVYAMKYLKNVTNGEEAPEFETEKYDELAVAPHLEKIESILLKRQIDASADWKAFGESLSGKEVPDFDIDRYQEDYMRAGDEDKDNTFLGRFIIAALAQKSMVTNRIFESKNLLAGFSVDYRKRGFTGIRDFWKLVKR